MDNPYPNPCIVFLSDGDAGPAASGPNAVAFYLSHAFPEALDIRLFNYVNNHAYRWHLAEKSFVDCGSIGGETVFSKFCDALQCTGYLDKSLEDVNTLRFLHKLTTQPTAPTRHFTPKLLPFPPGVAKFARRGIKHFLKDRDPGSVCFVVCPNARNIPAGLLAFSHKLSYPPGGKQLLYTDKNGKAHDCSHLAMRKAEAACALSEIALCQAIIDWPGARYLGNCYGSQVMWVAMGFGLTTFKRHRGVFSNASVVLNEDVLIDVRWSEGIYIKEPVNSTECLRETVPPDQQLELFLGYDYAKVKKDLEYNTDYHHSFMMVAPSAELPMLKDVVVCNSQYTWSSRIATTVKRNSDNFTRKLAHLTSPGQSKYWVGMYSFEQRIFGFQGHPLYHMTEYSSAWNAIRPTCERGDNSVHNPCYLGNQLLIWDLVFAFPRKGEASSDKRVIK